MTLGEGKRKVLMIIDEYSSGEIRTVDQDIDLKMADFFDLAQRDVAQYKPILKNEELTLTGEGACSLPARFKKLYRLWDGTKDVTARATIRGGQLLVPFTGTLLMEYIADPAPVGPETPDEYEFEVAEDAAVCMPYYVSCLQLLVDLVIDYTPPLGLYDRMVQQLDTSLPGDGSRRIRQALFR